MKILIHWAEQEVGSNGQPRALSDSFGLQQSGIESQGVVQMQHGPCCEKAGEKNATKDGPIVCLLYTHAT